ncbi:putative disease resistance protein RGA4 isoform X3 [Prosopis cineraria]|uniref:putative disease resistance protein RGA4 isoform X3 n=1 Tax=Prosopis cineraria TaxID=364024 RepID=UPI00240FBD45|nr:putative disease resistance protein RGA4 isoform X3 [Prosopis cineraria]
MSSDPQTDEMLLLVSSFSGVVDSPASDSKAKKPPKRRSRASERAPTTLVFTNPADLHSREQILTGAWMHESHDVSLDLFPFVSHCSLFSLGSEFTKLDLISLWIAEGLFLSLIDDSRKAEDVASDVFDSLVSHRVLVFSRFDKIPDFMNPGIGRLLYKVNDSSTLPPSFRPALLDNRYAMVSDNNFYRVPETILHLSILCNSVNQMNFEAMQKFVHLRSLFIFPSRGPSVEQVPRDLFLWLKHLRSLNLSGSHLSIIPSSIGNLKWLIYMDLSYTPIKFLPDAMVSLHNLQTLKLRKDFNQQDHAFPKLQKLTIESMSKLEDWTGIQNGLR